MYLCDKHINMFHPYELIDWNDSKNTVKHKARRGSREGCEEHIKKVK